MEALGEDAEPVEDREPGMMIEGKTKVAKMVGGTRSSARKEVHGGIEGRRSHYGEAHNDPMGTDNGDGAKGGGTLDADGEQMGSCDTSDPGGHNGATLTSVQGVTRVSEG